MGKQSYERKHDNKVRNVLKISLSILALNTVLETPAIVPTE